MAYPSNTASGVVVAGTSVAGNALNQFGMNIRYNFVDSNGNIYIADRENSRVVRWPNGGSTGSVVAGNGTDGVALSQVNFPYGLWVDSSSNLFVVEYSNHRVTRWAAGSTLGVVVAGTTNSTGR